MNLEGNQLGWRGYANVVRCIQLRPVHAVELMKRVNMTRDTARRILRRLNDLRVIHVSDWAKVPPSKTYLPVYAYGDKPDVPCPGGIPGGCTRQPWRQHNRLPELSQFITIIKLMEEPITLPELVEKSGSPHSNLRLLVKHMRKINLCRIGDWDVTDRSTVAMYVMGQGGDKARPKRGDHKLANRLYRQRIKARNDMLRVVRALAANAPEIAEAA